MPRWLSGARVVQTIHGLDDRRAKWRGPAQAVLRIGGWLSVRVPDSTIVVSRELADPYTDHHRRPASHIPNGVVVRPIRPAAEIRRRLGLEPGSYVLFVGRLVQEKAPDLLVRAFRGLRRPLRLVVAGGSSYTDTFVDDLHRTAADDARVLFPGYVYGPLLDELYANAAAFVLPSMLEGLPLTLLEAASVGVPVVASAIPPHVEVLGRDGPGRRLFAPNDERGLLAALERSLSGGASERLGARALQAEVLRRYDWDRAAESTERVYLGLAPLTSEPTDHVVIDVRDPVVAETVADSVAR